jgi:quercetin dioxygenase-like cupin family protein
MSDPRVIRREEIDSVQRAPGVSVASSVTKEVGATEISSGITTFQAGTSNTTHYHNAEESVIVIEGEGILMINGEENHVRQYDAAFITPGTDHRLINTGEAPFKIAGPTPP